MIDQSALEQGSVTYQEIVAEGKRLVDALKELAVAVSIYHREQFPEFPHDIGAPKLQFIDLAFN